MRFEEVYFGWSEIRLTQVEAALIEKVTSFVPVGFTKPGDAELPISHSICSDCGRKLRSVTNTIQPNKRKENDK